MRPTLEIPKRPAHMAGETLTALLLTAALALGGILTANMITGSALYRQSKVIGSIFSDNNESFGVSDILWDAGSRAMLLKFAGALADAYVSFELIPVNEAATFAAVYESTVPAVEIDGFSYRRKDLIITGAASDESAYFEFVRRLRAKNHFDSVSGHYYITTGNLIRFELQCLAGDI